MGPITLPKVDTALEEFNEGACQAQAGGGAGLCSDPAGQIRESFPRAEVASFSKAAHGEGWAKQRPLNPGLPVVETQTRRIGGKGRDHTAHLYGNR